MNRLEATLTRFVLAMLQHSGYLSHLTIVPGFFTSFSFTPLSKESDRFQTPLRAWSEHIPIMRALRAPRLDRLFLLRLPPS
jgi:hypothetical protein